MAALRVTAQGITWGIKWGIKMRNLLFAAALVIAAPVQAAVVDAGATGMEVKHAVHIAAPPQKVWEALIQPSRWWSSEHTFSGSAANLSLDPKAGGRWCETLPNGGSVMHMTVGFIAPPRSLVLRGALGPFYNLGIEGAMVWTLATKNGAAKDAETDVTLNYRAGGYVKDGFGKWAEPVDGVLAEQIARLKQAVEGKP